VVDLEEFVPTLTQHEFLTDEASRIKAMIGGLGSGKSRTGAEAFVDLVLANPGCDLLMAGPTHEMTRDLCVPAFEAACPRELIVRYVKSEKRYDLRGGRTVKHASADKPSTLEGRNLAGFWADEARYWPAESWRNLLARLRAVEARRLQGLVTTTPAMNWLADEFNASKPGRVVYRASTLENAHNLAPGYIDDLRRTYSPRLARSLIDGEFSVVSGQVYEEFDDAKHLVDWAYDPALPLWLSWDFGVRAASILFAQQVGRWPVTTRDGRTLPPGSVVIFDELQLEQKPTAHQIPDVQRRLAGRKVSRIVCDPAGRQRGPGGRDAFDPIARGSLRPRGSARPHGRLEHRRRGLAHPEPHRAGVGRAVSRRGRADALPRPQPLGRGRAPARRRQGASRQRVPRARRQAARRPPERGRPRTRAGHARIPRGRSAERDAAGAAHAPHRGEVVSGLERIRPDASAAQVVDAALVAHGRRGE
jgi:hypothetical protein